MALEQRHVLIAIPVHTGDVRVETMNSVIDGMLALQKVGIVPSRFGLNGCSLIPEARDICVGQFLSGDYTDLVWIDADIEFSFLDLIRLINHPVDVVAGLYRFKKDLEEYPVNTTEGELWARDPITGQPSEDGLLEVQHVPMGFCRMRRSVLERMAEARKDYKFKKPPFDFQCWGMFDREVSNGETWGEDYTFCKRWREIGGKVYVDPWMTLGHVGSKVFRGSFANYIRSSGKPDTPEQALQKMQHLREAFSNPEFRQNMKLAIGG